MVSELATFKGTSKINEGYVELGYDNETLDCDVLEVAVGRSKKLDIIQRRVLQGRVISNKIDKAITVLIERRVKHPIYGKYLTRTTKLKAHDETNQCNEGDIVTLAESSPSSRSKTSLWNLICVVDKTTK
jgi:small subunit ribosomal protein S17